MIPIKEINMSNEEVENAKVLLSEFLNLLNEGDFYSKSPNKKDNQFNLTVHKNDLVVIDELAAEFSVKRSEIIGTLMNQWIIELFNLMPDRDKRDLSILIDEEITKKNHKHHYDGKTWKWKVSRIIYDSVCDDDNETLITRSK